MYASADDVAAAWRPLTDSELSTAEQLAEYASVLVRATVPDVDQRIADGLLSADVVRFVVVQMVRRAMLNPGGVQAVTQSAGPFSETRAYAATNGGSDLLSLTGQELVLLTGRGRMRAGSVRLKVPSVPRCW